VHRSNTRNQILTVLEEMKPKAMGPSQIANATGINLKTVEQQLYRMLKDGEITLQGRGRYVAT
jgi:predicted transcriptional regulator